MRFARLAGLLLVGCAGIARIDGSDPMSPKELIDPLFEAFAEDPAESLPITGPVNLDVDIFRGDVLVRRADGLESPRLITTRLADFGAGRSEDGFLALDAVQIKAPNPGGYAFVLVSATSRSAVASGQSMPSPTKATCWCDPTDLCKVTWRQFPIADLRWWRYEARPKP